MLTPCVFFAQQKIFFRIFTAQKMKFPVRIFSVNVNDFFSKFLRRNPKNPSIFPSMHTRFK